MKKIETCIKDCFEIEFQRYGDSRGFFEELYSSKKYDILPGEQINCSMSKKGVIRGIHCSSYYKLCSCLKGTLYDVAVDLREESPTYLKWHGVWLEEDKMTQLLIPPGCGHGFYSAEDNTLLVYIQGGVYSNDKEKEIRWNDPTIGIGWPYNENYIISDKDRNSNFLK